MNIIHEAALCWLSSKKPLAVYGSEFQMALFIERPAAVQAECCDDPSEDCSGGAPHTCNAGCAAVFLPFWADCGAQLGPNPQYLSVVTMCQVAGSGSAAGTVPAQSPAGGGGCARHTLPARRGVQSPSVGCPHGCRPCWRCASMFCRGNPSGRSQHAQRRSTMHRLQ
eukprot:COSAG01_NODE_23731_length_803_cov_9.666193_1_plen_167_part_00